MDEPITPPTPKPIPLHLKSSGWGGYATERATEISALTTSQLDKFLAKKATSGRKFDEKLRQLPSSVLPAIIFYFACTILLNAFLIVGPLTLAAFDGFGVPHKAMLYGISLVEVILRAVHASAFAAFSGENLGTKMIYAFLCVIGRNDATVFIIPPQRSFLMKYSLYLLLSLYAISALSFWGLIRVDECNVMTGCRFLSGAVFAAIYTSLVTLPLSWFLFEWCDFSMIRRTTTSDNKLKPLPFPSTPAVIKTPLSWM